VSRGDYHRSDHVRLHGLLHDTVTVTEPEPEPPYVHTWRDVATGRVVATSHRRRCSDCQREPVTSAYADEARCWRCHWRAVRRQAGAL